MTQRFQIEHRTSYRYEGGVNLGHNVARFLPVELPYQRCLSGEIRISPTPRTSVERTDHFGNRTLYFSIEGDHSELEVTASSVIETVAMPFEEPATSPEWDRADAPYPVDVQEFLLPSPLVRTGREFLEFGRPVFRPGRPVHECSRALMELIVEQFEYNPSSSTVGTKPETALAQRSGVCQDFAHVFLATARAYGLPARYVSGYLETDPPPGQVKLRGSDASHAWVGIFTGDSWLDYDPTNNQLPNGRYITTAFGRDYSDVPPLRGVIFGGGKHKLDVAVDVLPLS